MKRLVPTLAIALAALACLPAGAQAAFGLDHFDVTFTNEEGAPTVQAGSHPFAFTTSLEANASNEETEGRLQELFLDLPPGLIANATAGPRCLEATFLDPGEECPLSTVVGTSSSSFLEPSHSESTPVYSLAPPAGVPLRLGFRVGDVAAVLVDVGLSPDPPYNPIAVAGAWPEAVDVFTTEVSLWGVPADAAHDAQRGGPVNVPQVPLLTLPTSCQGPQATYYEALSWEGDEDSGSVFTHDSAEPPNPMGFTGCNKLAFTPAFSASPTTEAAQSPSGFELALDVSDEGLINPEGLAQSQVRDLVLALPEAITLNPAFAVELESCTEADLQEETLEPAPGAGCPEASKLGTIEVETPLLDQALEGSIFLGEPFEGEPTLANLYIVIRNHELGIVIKQIAEVEQDPETGQLVAFAEELPELPFSHLRLHLREVEGAPLITPSFCASYDGHDAAHEPIWAELTPWSGKSPFVVSSSFQIVSGPNGGPCPTADGEQPASPPASGTTSPGVNPDTTPPDTQVFKSVQKRRPPIFVFHFQSTEPGSTFRCKLDKGPLANCSNSKRFGHLRPGPHTFRAVAVDPSGNADPSPAIAQFTVQGRRRKGINFNERGPGEQARHPNHLSSCANNAKLQRLALTRESLGHAVDAPQPRRGRFCRLCTVRCHGLASVSQSRCTSRC